MFVQNVCKIVLIFFVLFSLSLLFFSQSVRADGGAPNLAYISGTSQGISVIDVAQQKVTNSISVTGDPHTILLSVDGRLLYVTQPALHSMTVFVTQTKKPLCSVQLPSHPSLLTLDPGTNTLYVAGSDTNVVSALDPTTCAIEHTVHTNSPVGGMAVAVIGGGISGGSGNQLWVADRDGLTIFDAAGKKLATIPVEGGPEYLCIPPGGMVYVTTHQGSVEAVDIPSLTRCCLHYSAAEPLGQWITTL